MAEIDGGKLHATRTEWLRLAAVVTASRKRAGYSSMATLARAGRMSTSTVSSIERAASDAYWTQSIDKLEDALRWRRGAAKDVLEAEDLDVDDQDAVDELVLAAPVHEPEPVVALQVTDGYLRQKTTAELAEIQRRVQDEILRRAQEVRDEP